MLSQRDSCIFFAGRFVGHIEEVGQRGALQLYKQTFTSTTEKAGGEEKHCRMG